MALTAALAVAGCTGKEPFSVLIVPIVRDCVDLPSGADWAEPGSVSIGRDRYVILALTAPGPATRAGFPWLDPVVSDPSTLTPVPLCPPTPVTFGLETKYFAFAALKSGVSTVDANISAAWKSACSEGCDQVHAESLTVSVP